MNLCHPLPWWALETQVGVRTFVLSWGHCANASSRAPLLLGAVLTCQIAHVGSTGLHPHSASPTGRLGSPATPRSCGTSAAGRALGCSPSLAVKKASAREVHLQGFHTQNSCAGSSPWDNAEPPQGSAVSCHTCIMNASFAFSPSELCGI